MTGSLAHYHLGVAEHLVVDHVALLDGVENLPLFRLVGHRHHGYCLVAVGVEGVVGGIELLDSVLGELFLKFVVDEHHPLLHGLAVGSRL